jgi:hypothetical protein
MAKPHQIKIGIVNFRLPQVYPIALLWLFRGKRV